MPIPADKLRDAQRPLSERIVEFLSAHPESAFSFYEIVASIEGYDDVDDAALALVAQGAGPGAMRTLYIGALKQLLASEAIAGAKVKGDVYYALARRKQG